jgi:hypothetical protein
MFLRVFWMRSLLFFFFFFSETKLCQLIKTSCVGVGSGFAFTYPMFGNLIYFWNFFYKNKSLQVYFCKNMCCVVV